MLPATICAGMTLPLITYQLLSHGHGESAIGNVYAWNTLVAILGIVLSIQWIMPYLGLKNVVLVGSGIDIVLGISIILTLAPVKLISSPHRLYPSLLSILVFVLVLLYGQLDPLSMASGIYTTGEIKRNREMIFIKDGKTASISFFRNDDYLAIATNGKTEAAISDRELAKDEPTMILLGLLPLSLKQNAKTIATIGIGSGLTTHSLLLSHLPQQVDTIEIEPAMVEAARLFGERVDKTFTDHRSNIYIEDAKAFFSYNKPSRDTGALDTPIRKYRESNRYDVIISEPSNPWVSGVAGLFSMEFYQHVRRYLNDDGLLVQWIHLYHIDLPQIASVVKALSPHFNDYRIYALNLSDIAIVAAKFGVVPPISDHLFQEKIVAHQLERLGIVSEEDLYIRNLGNKNKLDIFFNSFSVPAHSDFTPYLDFSASRSRFLRASATGLLQLASIPKAFHNFIGQNGQELPQRHIGNNYHLPIAKNITIAQKLTRVKQPAFSMQCQTKSDSLRWIQQVHQFADITLPYFGNGEIDTTWQMMETSDCLSYLSETSRLWVKLYRALANSDAPQVILSAKALFPRIQKPVNLGEQYLVAALLAAYAQLDQHQEINILSAIVDLHQIQTVALRYVSSHLNQCLAGCSKSH
jgi:spermidine synthase